MMPMSARDPVDRHVVLVAPEIHWNTGNIGRTCLAVDAQLHLIRPLGFSLDAASLKRAGLDYWARVRASVWRDFTAFCDALCPAEEEVALFTKLGQAPFWRMRPPARMFLVFGSETRGLPGEVLSIWPNNTYHIPMTGAVRSLNLSTAVGIALYESLRGCASFHGWHRR
jgi:tRNA (cytidine/uridine-2'-O-)-methyltransferase